MRWRLLLAVVALCGCASGLPIDRSALSWNGWTAVEHEPIAGELGSRDELDLDRFYARESEDVGVVYAPSLVVIGEGARPGWRAVFRRGTGDESLESELTVVGATAESWLIELRCTTKLDPPCCFALVVDRRTSRVREAWTEDHGGRELRSVEPSGVGPLAGEQLSTCNAELTRVECHPALGSYQRVVERFYVRSWGLPYSIISSYIPVADIGEVLFDLSGIEGTSTLTCGPRLTAISQALRVQVEAREVDAWELEYSDGEVVVLTRDPIVTALSPALLTAPRVGAVAGKDWSLVRFGEDGRRRLPWPEQFESQLLPLR